MDDRVTDAAKDRRQPNGPRERGQLSTAAPQLIPYIDLRTGGHLA
jgi:hypothetical protein